MEFAAPEGASRALCVLEVDYTSVSATPERFVGHLIGIRDVALLASSGACPATTGQGIWCGCGRGQMYLSASGHVVPPAREIVVGGYYCSWFNCWAKCPVPAQRRYRLAGRLGGHDQTTGLPNRVLSLEAIQMLE